MKPAFPYPRYCIAIFVLVCAFMPQQARAQFRAVIHSGMSASTFRGESLDGTSRIHRLMGGGGLRYEYPSGFEFETGVYYVVKGGALTGTYEEIPIEGVSEITYVEVPVLLGYRMTSMRRFSPRLVAGPSMAFKSDAQITFNAVGSDFEQTEEDTTVEARDLGLVVGFDINTRVGSETLSLGIRSTFGLANARTEKPEIFNSSFAIMAGIVF